MRGIRRRKDRKRAKDRIRIEYGDRCNQEESAGRCRSRDAQKEKKEMRIQRLIVTLQFLGIAAVVVLIFYILMGISTVDGNSMYPTLHDKDIVIYNRRCKEYKAGDIVRSPGHPERSM